MAKKEKGYVYFVESKELSKKFQNKVCKIGSTKYPTTEKRLNELNGLLFNGKTHKLNLNKRYGNAGDWNIIGEIETGDCRLLEKLTHKYFNNLRITGISHNEIFRIDAKSAFEEIKNNLPGMFRN